MIKKLYFIVLTFLLYFFSDTAFSSGRIYIRYEDIIFLLMILSTVAVFLYKPNISKAVIAVKDGWTYYVPYFFIILISLLIWVIRRTDIAVIRRCLSKYFLQYNYLLAVFAAAAVLYIFGKKAIKINFYVLVVYNLYFIATIVYKNGAAVYFRELLTLITSFASVTGTVIKQAELHEVNFCISITLLYLFCFEKLTKRDIVFVVLAVFCIINGLKRITVAALAVAAAVFIVIKLIRRSGDDKKVQSFIKVSLVLICIMSFAYIVIIDSGLFDLMEQKGFDTNLRAELYEAVKRYYSLTPDFVGYGYGYISREFAVALSLFVDELHNQYVQYYIDLGFFGFFIWMYFMTIYRVRNIHKDNLDDRIVTFIIVVCLAVLGATDNTFDYLKIVYTTVLIVVGYGIDRRSAELDKKHFGTVTEENLIPEEPTEEK